MIVVHGGNFRRFAHEPPCQFHQLRFSVHNPTVNARRSRSPKQAPAVNRYKSHGSVSFGLPAFCFRSERVSSILRRLPTGRPPVECGRPLLWMRLGIAREVETVWDVGGLGFGPRAFRGLAPASCGRFDHAASAGTVAVRRLFFSIAILGMVRPRAMPRRRNARQKCWAAIGNTPLGPRLTNQPASCELPPLCSSGWLGPVPPGPPYGGAGPLIV